MEFGLVLKNILRNNERTRTDMQLYDSSTNSDCGDGCKI